MNNRVANAADHNAPEHPIAAAIATVAHAERDGTPTVLDVDGVLFRRENSQQHARKSLEEHQRWNKALAYGLPPELLADLEKDAAGQILDDWQRCMRRIGEVLVYHGQHALWQLVYLEWHPGDSYALGDETLFLNGEPTSGEPGYKGPTAARRYNTALEQAAQLTRRES
jgi:hypothetical protein